MLPEISVKLLGQGWRVVWGVSQSQGYGNSVSSFGQRSKTGTCGCWSILYVVQSVTAVGNGLLRYRELLSGAWDVAQRLRGRLPRRTGKWGPRVGLYLTPSVEYVTATWGTWMAGGIVVPLSLSHSTRELTYVIQDTAMPIVSSVKIRDPC